MEEWKKVWVQFKLEWVNLKERKASTKLSV